MVTDLSVNIEGLYGVKAKITALAHSSNNIAFEVVNDRELILENLDISGFEVGVCCAELCAPAFK